MSKPKVLKTLRYISCPRYNLSFDDHIQPTHRGVHRAHRLSYSPYVPVHIEKV